MNPEKVRVEPELKFPHNLRYRERLRLGTPALLNKIRDSGINLWIYTTSFRSEHYIRGLFKHYGVKLDRVINGQTHQNDVQRNFKEILPSKMPSRYRIDLHVDDELSVKQYGDIYGFKMFLLNEENPDWAEQLWAVIEKLRAKIAKQPN